jgi:PAS domain S-box-containing protein
MSDRVSDTLARWLEGMAEAVVAVDSHGTVTYVTAAAEALFGWSRGELVGMPVTVVVPPSLREYLPKEASDFQGALGAMVGRPFRTFSRRRDGSEIPTEVVLGVVETDTGLVFTGTVRRRHAPSLSRWSALTATLFDTLNQLDPAGSSDDQLLEALGHQLDCDLATLWALDGDGRLVCRSVWSNVVSDPQGRFKVARSPETFNEVSLPQYVLRTGEPLWVPDLAADNRFAPGPAARSGLTTAIVFPVRYGGAVVGVVELFTAEQRPGDPGLVDLVRAVSRPVGELLGALEVAAERERLVRDLTKAQMRQEFVLRAARVVSEAATYTTTLDRLAAVAVPVLGDLCIIDVVGDDGEFQRMACHHRDPSKAALVQELRERYSPDPNGPHPTVDVIAHGRSRWSGVMTDDFLRATCRDERHYEIVKALGFESYMAVPLMAEGRVLGTVTLVSAGSGRRFEVDDLDWAEQLASQVASVLDHARRHQEEMTVSHTFQRSLLPGSLPKVEGVEIAARYLPATTYAAVGGDWYDAVADDDRLCLVIGDVEGHDLHAATIMANLRHGLCLLLAEGMGPTEALDRLNRFSIRSRLDRLATLLIADLNLVDGTMAVATAGHFPPVVRSNGSTQFIEVLPAPPIGVDNGRRPEQMTVNVAEADVLLFTDGLVEDPAADLDGRLAELVGAVADGPQRATGLCDHVLGTLVPGRERLDDVALLVASIALG